MSWRRLGWPAFVVTLMTVGPACSKGRGRTPADAASGGAGAATATGGAGAGAGGGSSGTGGGATDGGADKVAMADAPATRAEQACREAIIVQCVRQSECYGSFPDQKACEEYADRCPDYYFGPRSSRTVEAIEACTAAIRQMTCTDILMGLNAACLGGGIGAAGAPCSSASECQSRACSGLNPTCGTCYAPLDLGAACGSVSNGVCRTGTICHPGRRVCVALPLVVGHARLGEPCDTAGDPPVGCEGDLVCLRPRASTAGGTCVDLPKAGEPCLDGATPQCGKGLGCGVSTADGGRALLCGNPPPCGTTTCAAGDYCYEAPAVSIRCVAAAKEGEACYYNVPEGDKRCAVSLFCTEMVTVVGDGGITGWRGSCHALVDRGDTCDAARRCRDGLACVAGKCGHFDGETCFLPSDGGAGQ